MCTSLCPRHLLGHSIQPHDFMRSLANGITSDTDSFLNSFFCCSCGLCEMYSCHQDLSPRTLLDAYKGGLRSRGVRVPDKKDKGQADPMREERKVPEHRLVARLGLTPYDIPAPMVEYQGKIETVRLLLRQSIGAPCVPTVKQGDTVSVGDPVAVPPEGALGVCLHAGISGKITMVNEQSITICAK
jgi:Na+-translocating ferredoxin:NAD+ oxidoreductase RnfC subunit